MRNFRLWLFCAMLMVTAMGCSSANTDGEPAAPEPNTLAMPTADSIITPLPSTESEPESPTTMPNLKPGEVPQKFFDAILADLLNNFKVESENVSVVTSEAVVWNDGSLGCPQPGMLYTQAIINGYRIILKAGDETFDYHLSDRGYFVLCDNSLPSIRPQSTPAE